MIYTLEEIKQDLHTLNTKQFYKRYIVKSDNWYFRNVLGIPESSVIDVVDEFRDIVSSNIGVSFNSVMMVGSGKIGYSLSPTKKFKKFEIDEESKNKSDIDIAIISEEIFEHFWKMFRQSYSVQNSYWYRYISREIYRGYINEKNLRQIDACRKEWIICANKANRMLKSNLFLRHEITYRIYRRWEDFEEYNLSSIKIMQDEVNKNGV